MKNAYEGTCLGCHDPLGKEESLTHWRTCADHPAGQIFRTIDTLAQMAQCRIVQGDYAEAVMLLERIRKL